jgi:methylmalonyl-CoA/ethylmalonyl-CoA epimerase
MLKRLDHVSIGVLDIDKARELFCDVLGGEILPDAGESGDFDWMTFLLGGKKVEVVTPHVAGEGGVGSYLAKYGEGFHHLSCAVENLVEAREYFESKELRILGYNEDSPTFKHFYLHPKDTFGALIQVFEESEETLHDAGPPA